MHPEITSALNHELFQQKALAQIQIISVKRNAKGAITAITDQNATEAVEVAFRKVIINPAWTVDKGVIDVEGNKYWERLKVHAAPLVRYMGKGTEGLQKIWDEMHGEKEGLVISIEVE